jgi:PAS domain S-box-containing protein
MTGVPLRALIVEDSEDDMALIVRELRMGGYEPTTERVDDDPTLQTALERESWDVIICDYVIPGYGGLAALKRVQEMKCDTPFILISGKIGEDTAVECMKAGAHDYIMKNNMHRMVPAIRRELVEAQVRQERFRAMEETIRARKEWELTFDTVPDLITLLDPEYRIIRANRAFAERLGCTKDELIGKTCFSCVHQTDEPPRHCPQRSMIRDGTEQVIDVCEECLDGHFILSVTPIHDEQGKLVSIVHVARDITERKKSEQQIRTSLAEKEVLLRELHHRVKNNMQIISSLLNLQSRSIEDRKSQVIFRECQDRIRAMALIHEKLYRTGNLMQIPFREYVRTLTNDLSASYSLSRNLISIRMEESDEFFLSVNTAIPCGLIMNELITNALKHGLEDGRGTITIGIAKSDNDTVILSVSNEGVGLPAGFSVKRDGSMGLWLVKTLSHQINGTLEVLQNDACTTFQVHFSLQEKGKTLSNSPTQTNSSYHQ